MLNRLLPAFLLAIVLAGTTDVLGQPTKVLPGHVPGVVARLQANGRLAGGTNLPLSIGLPLRNQSELENFLGDVSNPGSPNFRKFLTPQEFTARFGPTEAEYLAAQNFARSNGFVITGTHSNRVVLDVEAPAAAVERAFRVTLRKYRHPTEAREFYAPDTEPSVPAGLPLADIWGLSDYGIPKPLSRKMDPAKIRALGGSGPSGYYAGNDFRNAYAPGTALTGAGQAVGLLQFSAYFQSDITSYQTAIGRTNFVTLNNVVIGHPAPTTADNAEVALDIEMAIAMAPGLSQVIVYEIRSVLPSSILSRMANDNLAKQLSSSWSWSGGPSTTVDNIFKQMAAQGQSFFQASGDSDAYTGAQILDNASQINSPIGSSNITTVGGTTLTMNGAGSSWASETVWNWNNLGQPNVGSSGGVSTFYSIPYWQTNMNTPANSGSATFRNVPDVALTGDAVYVIYDNGSSGGFGGTSCAAPLWAGFCALINQQSVAANGTTVGFVNPALYAIARGSSYTNCFHDITTGNNIGTNTPGLYNATVGYDLCTGLGTPNGTALINALAPSLPVFLSQPTSLTVTNGTSVALSGTASGSPPLVYRWLLNGTNLPAGGNVSGTASNVLSIVSATTNNSGSYRLVVTNSFGAVTSSVAVLNVGLPPAITTQPTNLTPLTGSNAVFGAVASGTPPLSFQWRKNGTNLVNGAGVAGATSNVLTLTAVTTNSGGNYSLFATNAFGTVTSSVAALTIVLPPSISGSITNQSVECGSNSLTFAVTASGTPPFGYQWSLDSVPVANATNTSFSLTNLMTPNHTVSVMVTNLYASIASNVVVTVFDTIGPAIFLNGTNPTYVELGEGFNDPGATANDGCAGAVAVTVGGIVNTNAVGTNVLTYSAADGSGNTNSTTRNVIVRDTTPPTISWSFTNLVLAADTNCAGQLPDLTGTNFIVAIDLSAPLSISQSPTNNFILVAGTNVVVIAVADAFGNTAYSTNTVFLQDQTPPAIALNGDNPMFSAVGAGFVDPGATANDACAGVVPVTASGAVNTNAVGTNTITYTADDGSGNTNNLTRTVIVVYASPVISSAVIGTNGVFTLTYTGTPGATYILQSVPDLLLPGWQPLDTNTLDGSGVGQFDDEQAGDFLQRFYRLMLMP